ncbi:MAG: amidohydrolase [Candidatus Marinimicrobia bacterium]|nr:amidohydrolase [Candidatus Neomarinimicrobiota bacterium]
MPVAEIIFTNAQVLTRDSDQPRASQLAIQGNRIVAVGDDLSSCTNDETVSIDLKRSIIVPGFIDAHVHFLWGGASLLTIQAQTARSRQEFMEIVSRFARGRQPGSWLKGGGWNEHLFSDKGLPHKSWLDEAAPGYPMILQRHDGHSGIASSRALELAEITASTPDPEGGLIDRDESGEPTGILRDSAMGLVMDLIPEETELELDQYFNAAQNHLLDHGVTAIADMIHDLKHFQFLQKMAVEGKLKLRVTAYTPLLKWEEMKAILVEGIYEDEWFQFKGLKGFCDGSLGSRTALMLEPYENTPISSGIHDTDWSNVDLIEKILTEADQNGYQVLIHAIGDRANREVLDIFEAVIQKNGPRDRRFRIEHAQHIHPTDQKRISSLNVIASVQPAHCVDDSRYADDLLGERSQYAYPFQAFLKKGVRLAFGSDWPVSPPDPIATIHGAIHRGGWRMEQALEFEQALDAHTQGSAYACFREHDLGKLKAGHLADFAILGPEFAQLPGAEKIPENLIRSVYVNGSKVR